MVAVMLEGGGIKLLTVRGVPVRLHWTFFLAVPWIAFSMSRQFAGREDLSLPAPVWGLLLATLLFASVLLHELGHVFVARSQGSTVRGITLMLLGGVSHMERISDEPRSEAKMAIAGPLVSLVIALVSYACAFLIHVSDVRFGFASLAQINLVVAVFNLLPAFPLDGGRVLRSLLAVRRGKPEATRIAAIVGRMLAIALGLLALLSGNFLLGLIALFIWGGAGAEASLEAAREELSHVRVAELARGLVPMVFAEDTVERAAQTMLFARCDSLLVRRADGALGVVTARAIAAVPRDVRERVLIDSIARFDAPTIDANMTGAQALEAIERTSVVPVTNRGELAGVLERSAVLRWLELHKNFRPSLA